MRKPRYLTALVVCGTIVLATAVTIDVNRYGGPVSTGALLLLVDPPADSHPHPLPDDYKPVHHGDIDLGTGLYTRTDEDLVVRGPVPLFVRRTYLSEDRRSRAFGVGSSHDGESFVVGDRETFQTVSIVLGSGSQLQFDRVSPGHSFDNAVFRHTASPTRYYGAFLGWVGNSWAVRLRDGEFMEFEGCWGPKPRPCGLVQSRDVDGHVLRLSRDADGLLQRMDTGNEWIAFQYDAQYRVTRAWSSEHGEVRYEYDERGRLARAVGSGGATHAYTYTDRDEMATAAEPDIAIENEYDADGRCVRQVHRFPGSNKPLVLDVDYQLTARHIVQTDARWSDGSWRRLTFNTSGYVASEEFGRGARSLSTARFKRDPESNLTQEIGVTCQDGHGSEAEHRQLVSPGEEERVEGELLDLYCGRPSVPRAQ